jgi:hypothetical protein
VATTVTETDQKKAGAAASDKNSTSSQHDGGSGGGGGGGGGFKDSDATFVADQAEGTATATPAATATASIGKQVMDALERGNRALAQQLEAHKRSWDADREQRAALLRAMDRVADAVCRIADKL